jgi:hypothetical protein
MAISTQNISHDGVSHHPLGAGSYYFADDLIEYLETLTQPDRPAIKICVGAQPNSSPHIGNIINICTAFSLAKALRDKGNKVSISMDLVDTAPTPEQGFIHNGISYQRSLRFTKHSVEFEGEFKSLVERLHELSGIEFKLRKQSDIMAGPGMKHILQDIVKHHNELGPIIEPRYKRLGLRSACPEPDCGLCDKHGLTNKYGENSIIFICPIHGAYSVSLLEDNGIKALELNTPLRSLVRTLVFNEDPDTSWIQVKGRDYAGFYTEQLMWRPLMGRCRPVVFYSPLVLDWSGAKISKSLVVQHAYQYLHQQGLIYLLSYSAYQEAGRDIKDIYQIVRSWVLDPKKLFRDYTIFQIHLEIQSLSHPI